MIPNAEFHDARTVSFTMDVEEGGPFRLGSVIVSGLTEDKLNALIHLLQPFHDQPFTPKLRDAVPKLVSRFAPCHKSAEFEVYLGAREHRVSFFFDYSDCYDAWLESLDRVPDTPQ